MAPNALLIRDFKGPAAPTLVKVNQKQHLLKAYTLQHLNNRTHKKKLS